MLTNCPKNSDMTRSNLFLLLPSQMNKRVVSNWFRADLISVFGPVNMLSAEALYERWPIGHLSSYLFRSY